MKCKTQQSIYLSPDFETLSPAVILVNHLEYTDKKKNQSLTVLLTAEVFSLLL